MERDEAQTDVEELIAQRNELGGQFFDAEAEALKAQARLQEASAQISQINAALARAGVQLPDLKGW